MSGVPCPTDIVDFEGWRRLSPRCKESSCPQSVHDYDEWKHLESCKRRVCPRVLRSEIEHRLWRRETQDWKDYACVDTKIMRPYGSRLKQLQEEEAAIYRQPAGEIRDTPFYNIMYPGTSEYFPNGF